MDSTRLFELFRSDVADEAKPYLWKDIEVWEYMDSAYKAFVRLTGGIADFTSSITEVSATANEPTSEVSKRILRFMYAQRTSDNRPSRSSTRPTSAVSGVVTTAATARSP